MPTNISNSDFVYDRNSVAYDSALKYISTCVLNIFLSSASFLQLACDGQKSEKMPPLISMWFTLWMYSAD